VNNAAANFPAPAEDMSANAWRTVLPGGLPDDRRGCRGRFPDSLALLPR